MRMLNRNKQKMWYSHKNNNTTIYDTDENENVRYLTYTDEDGNEIFILDENGNKIPRDTGETGSSFGEPVEFRASITNKLNEVIWQEYGIDDSTNYAQITSAKGYLSLSVGDYVWKKTKPTSNVEDADYIVKGVADEGLSIDLFLLKRNV